MITTLTLNPCIDKTVTVKSFDAERVNRAESVRLDPGGKGINVSLALAALGIKSRAVGVLCRGGEAISEALERAGVEGLFIPSPGEIRTNLKIFDRSSRRTIELNEQNPPLPENCLKKAVAEVCKSSADSEVLVLSGSVPPGVGESVYREIIEAARLANPEIKTVLDAGGGLLKNGLGARPFLIKPNVEELEQTFGVKIGSDAEAVSLCRKIIADFGVGAVLLSMGSDGALAVTSGAAFRGKAVRIEPKSAQGAGDAMVAGACAAILGDKTGADELLKFGLACAAGAVESEGTGFGSRERFEELLKLAEVERIIL